MRPTELDYAYAAGIIDGEGRINSQDQGHGVRVGFTNTDKSVIDWFQKRWPGHVYATKPQPNRKICYQWSLGAQAALDFIEEITPFLIIKKNKAIYAVESYVECIQGGHAGGQRRVRLRA